MDVDPATTNLGRAATAPRLALELDERFQFAMSNFDVNLTELTETFIALQPLYFDNAGIWWAWNFNITSWEIIDEYDVLNLIKRLKAR